MMFTHIKSLHIKGRLQYFVSFMVAYIVWGKLEAKAWLQWKSGSLCHKVK